MKKLLLPFLSILLFVSCQKQIPDENKEIAGDLANKDFSKIDVCHMEGNHTSHIINISINAWPAHKAHGDVRLDDQDGDRYVPNNACSYGNQGDCDDNNASINPGAVEISGNKIDDNCNGQIDENCIPAVTIGNQVWMINNLDVDTFRNGELIPLVQDTFEWLELGSRFPAWCYYNNSSANGKIYGKLYNRAAVIKGIAPAGWHVPSNEEWDTLIAFLGGDEVAGGKMKAKYLWNIPNTGATNESGFTGLAGGKRPGPFGFSGIGTLGSWWSTSQSVYGYPEGRMLVNVYALELFSTGANATLGEYFAQYLGPGYGFNSMAVSVRCVKD